MNPIEEAMEIMMLFGKDGCQIMDSGGKDSTILKYIAELCREKYGMQYSVHHNHTTIDAPETVYFVRAEREREREPQAFRTRSIIPKKHSGSCAFEKVCCRQGSQGFVAQN